MELSLTAVRLSAADIQIVKIGAVLGPLNTWKLCFRGDCNSRSSAKICTIQEIAEQLITCSDSGPI